MLTDEQTFILYCLQKSLKQKTEQAETVPADADYVLNALKRGGILLTVYDVLPDFYRQKLKELYSTMIRQAVLQNYEGEQVLQALSSEGLDCIALKGWELRRLYPKMTMRQMADLDILVRPYEYQRIRSIMENLGALGEEESSWKHDSFIKDGVHFELHKRLTDDSDRIQTWEGRMWSRAIRLRDHVYEMSPEDYYVFHFVHLHKDFMNGSLGLRRIADTWLLQKQKVDRSAVRAILDEFGLLTFHDRMVKLSLVAMGEAEIDENCEIMLKHAFTHGIYGSDISYKAGRIAKMGKSMRTGKIRSAFAAAFLPPQRMKAQFPVLKKWPVLLPLCWGKRIVRLLHDNVKENGARLDYSKISDADYREMKLFFEAGGTAPRSEKE